MPPALLFIELYATGLRCAELTRLKVSDVDSQRMVIRVRGGKWGKDRDVMLSPKLREELRKHWRRLRRKPSAWLFPSNRWHTGDHPIDTKTLSLDEFLRRFLLHLLPKGFVRIRNSGFLANRRRATLLPLCFQLLGAVQEPQADQDACGSNDLWRCPMCGEPMVVVERLSAAEIELRSPPPPLLTAAA